MRFRSYRVVGRSLGKLVLVAGMCLYASSNTHAETAPPEGNPAVAFRIVSCCDEGTSVTFTVANNPFVPAALIVDDDACGTRNYSTISAALAAASDGRTIYVCPGTYAEKLTIDRDVKLISLAGAWDTIIDASSLAATSGVIQVNSSALLDGFTITGAHYDAVCYYGAVKVNNMDNTRITTPIIRHNRIIENESCGFGGLYVDGGQIAGQSPAYSTPTIENNIIACNKAHKTCAGLGVGDKVVNAKIYNNVIAYNEVNTDPITGVGSGSTLYLAGSCDLRNNIVAYNHTRGGSAVSSWTASAVLAYNDFYGNVDETGANVNYSGGTGNINVSPFFWTLFGAPDPSFALRPFSLCRNAGDPSSAFNDTDGTRNDMGVYGGPRGSW